MAALPPPDYVDDDGYRYYCVSAGARIIGAGLITQRTLWRYARAGRHPCGLDLCVYHQPLLRTGHQEPRSDRKTRPVIREDRLLALQELIRDHRRHRSGVMSDEDFELMRDAAKRFRLPRPSNVPR